MKTTDEDLKRINGNILYQAQLMYINDLNENLWYIDSRLKELLHKDQEKLYAWDGIKPGHGAIILRTWRFSFGDYVGSYTQIVSETIRWWQTFSKEYAKKHAVKKILFCLWHKKYVKKKIIIPNRVVHDDPGLYVPCEVEWPRPSKGWNVPGILFGG